MSIEGLPDVDVTILMERKVVSWTPPDPIPRKEGWKSACGQRNRSLRTVITCLVGQLIALHQGGGGHGRDHLLLDVKDDRAELPLDVTHDSTLGGGGGEAAATLGEALHKLVRQVPAG